MTSPTNPYWLFAICAGSGPVIVGTYQTEQEQRAAYALAQRRRQEGGFYSEDVRDFALGEDPAMRNEREAVPVELLEAFLGSAPEARAPPLEDRATTELSGEPDPEPEQSTGIQQLALAIA